MAVALVRPELSLAPKPSSVLLSPVAKAVAKSALEPINVLPLPAPDEPVSNPKKAFWLPTTLAPPASHPKKELRWPVVLRLPACHPKKELKLPSVEVPLGVFDAPAPTPPNVLLFSKEPP